MPKRKHTTTKNKNKKEHRNGIKKPVRGAPLNFKGGDLNLRKNDYYSKLYQGIGRAEFNKKYNIVEDQ